MLNVNTVMFSVPNFSPETTNILMFAENQSLSSDLKPHALPRFCTGASNVKKHKLMQNAPEIKLLDKANRLYWNCTFLVVMYGGQDSPNITISPLMGSQLIKNCRLVSFTWSRQVNHTFGPQEAVDAVLDKQYSLMGPSHQNKLHPKCEDGKTRKVFLSVVG